MHWNDAYEDENPEFFRRDRANERRPRGEDRVDANINSIMLKVPPFDGKDDLDAYFVWEQKIESIFLLHNYSEEKKVRLAAVEFYGYAVHWWEQLHKLKRRANAPPIWTWEEMKREMRKRFILSYFQRDLY